MSKNTHSHIHTKWKKCDFYEISTSSVIINYSFLLMSFNHKVISQVNLRRYLLHVVHSMILAQFFPSCTLRIKRILYESFGKYSVFNENYSIFNEIIREKFFEKTAKC